MEPVRTSIIDDLRQQSIATCERINADIVGCARPKQAIHIHHNGRKFELGQRIKESIYGDVYAGAELISDDSGRNFRRSEEVAIKVYKKDYVLNPGENISEDPFGEIATMQRLTSGPLTTSYVSTLIAFCEDDRYFYSVMPFYHGYELFDWVERFGKFNSIEHIRVLVQQMVDALHTLRQKGVAHRDISLENTMLLFSPSDRDNLDQASYKLIDFGLAKSIDLTAEGTVTDIVQQQYGRFCVANPKVVGKKNYMAPELLALRRRSTRMDVVEGEEDDWIDLLQCDLWSFGAMLLMVCTGQSLMESAVEADQGFQAIRSGAIPEILRYYDIFDPDFEDLMSRLLKVDPLERLTLAELLTHPFVQH